MRLLILQNADFEGPGLLLEWCRARKISHEVVRADETIQLPNAAIYSHLILLGSPHSVSETEILPWLKREAAWIEACFSSHKILGICLGAQLLAHLLGGKVAAGPHAELGWHDLTIRSPSPRWRELKDKTIPLFQWHREVFTLPPGAEAFASSPATPLQGFLAGENENILALAGHPEIDEALVEGFIAKCWSSGVSGRFVQEPREMREGAPGALAASREALFLLLDIWAQE